MKQTDWLDVINDLFELAKKELDSIPLTNKTGKINIKGDESIEMDVRIEELFIDYIKEHDLPADIFSEEIGTVSFHKNPQYLIVFDPLDGSTNYKLGHKILPYGVLIAIYAKSNPKLRDVMVAGMLDHPTSKIWIYDGLKTKEVKKDLVILSKIWPIHRSTPIQVDLYYKENYQKFSAMAGNLHIKNIGSTVGSILYLLTQTAAVYGSVCMRPEEVGAMYGLIKGAGGVVVDHRGNDLSEQDFNSDKTYEILAGNKRIVEFCVEELNKK